MKTPALADAPLGPPISTVKMDAVEDLSSLANFQPPAGVSESARRLSRPPAEEDKQGE